MVRDIDGPIARAVVFSRPRRGFDTRGLRLLGPLHVELSSGHRWNHPPLQQPAPPPVPADRVEVSSIFAPRNTPAPKRKHLVAPHSCSSARRHRYSNGSIGGPTHRRTATGLELAPPRLAPSAPPLGQRPPPDGKYPTPMNGKWYPPALNLAPLCSRTQQRPASYTPQQTHVCAG